MSRRKSQVRQQRRAAGRSDRISRISSPSRVPAESQKLTSGQALIFAAMAMKALHCCEAGAVWKASLPGNFAAVEFRASADIALKDYHEQESSIDFATHRVLVWERREKRGEALMMILSLDRLAVMAGMKL